ncbi:MAG TPA: tetratricopeptide repeat protein [Polyangiaceae bacterium]|nr:tetratricopeptide repeat protein [Polyangiaceae bacterium]
MKAPRSRSVLDPLSRARARRWARPLLVVATLGAAPRSVRADPARAEALFFEGRGLLDAEQLDEACPKFAESHRINPSIGALLSLGDCYERQGKPASATKAFREASKLATERGDAERAAEARRRAYLLDPKLSDLVLQVRDPTPGLVVKRDGEIVASAQFGARVPVDPGRHVITAEADGHLPYRKTVSVAEPGKALVIEVPPLAPLARAQTAPLTDEAGGDPAAPEPSGKQPTSGRTVAGLGVMGIGVAALGVGSVVGIKALSNYSKVDDLCSVERGCPDRDRAVDMLKRADTQAWAAGASIGLGLVGVAAGTYLLLVTPSKKPGSPPGSAVALTVAPGGLGLSGRF